METPESAAKTSSSPSAVKSRIAILTTPEPIEKKNLLYRLASPQGILIIAILIGLVWILGILVFFLFTQPKKQPVLVPPSNNQSTLSPTPLAVTPLPPVKKLQLYTLGDTILYTISTITPTSDTLLQPQIPAFAPAGFIYYIENNNVIAYSLGDKSKKILYTNTKLATILTKVTFSKGYLYISLLVNPSDPNFSQQFDRSSYLIAYSLATHEIHTLGPLKTITSGYISYLFNSQDTDILDVVETRYCKSMGEIYGFASGSATFLSPNGIGCNGEDPYLIGQTADNTSLIFANPDNTTQPDDFVTHYNGIYTKNLITNENQQIFKFLKFYAPKAKITPFKNEINNFALSEDKTIVYALLDTKILSINITETDDTKKLLKTTDLSKFVGYDLVAVIDNHAYLLNGMKNDISILNLADDTVTHIPQNTITGVPLFFLGVWNTKPLFVVNQ